MLSIEYKSFKIGKKVGRDYCEDAFAVSLDNTRFAVADGVSNSFRPEIVSQFLVKEFVDSELTVADWQKGINAETGIKLEQHWKDGVSNFLNEFEGFEREIQELRMQNVGSGASTFCGVVFNPDSDSLDYAVLGDSCIFIFTDDDTEYEVLTSCEKKKDEKGWIVNFTNTPACIQVGNYESISKDSWHIGTIVLQTGYVALMTDGVSQWLQQELSKDNTEVTDRLWNMLDDPQAFTDYIIRCRQAGSPLIDDIAILLIKTTLTDNSQNNKPDIAIHKPNIAIYTSEQEMPKYTDEQEMPNTDEIDSDNITEPLPDTAKEMPWFNVFNIFSKLLKKQLDGNRRKENTQGTA